MEARESNMNWIWGVLLIALGALFLLNQYVPFMSEVLSPVVILGGIGTVFLTVYLVDRENWWALIPAYVMYMIAGLFVASVQFGDAVFTLVPGLIGVPFLVVAIIDLRENWWALIPAYVLIAISALVFVEETTTIQASSAIPLAIGLPFLVTAAVNPRENWWALIPGGILAVVSLGIAVESAAWLLPTLMIAGGILLLFGSIRNRSKSSDEPREPVEQAPVRPTTEETPRYGPAADRPTE